MEILLKLHQSLKYTSLRFLPTQGPITEYLSIQHFLLGDQDTFFEGDIVESELVKEMIENRKRGAASNVKSHFWPIKSGKHEIPYVIGAGNVTSLSGLKIILSLVFLSVSSTILSIRLFL